MSKAKLQTIKRYRQLIQTYHLWRESLPEFILVKLCAEADIRIRALLAAQQHAFLFHATRQHVYDEISAMWIAYFSYYHNFVINQSGVFENDFIDIIWSPYANDYQSIFPGILTPDFFNKQLGAAVLFRRKQYEELLIEITDHQQFMRVLREVPVEPYMHPAIVDRLLPLIKHDSSAYDYWSDTNSIMNLLFRNLNLSEELLIRVLHALFPHDITIESRQTIHRIIQLQYIVIPPAFHSRLIDIILEVLNDKQFYAPDKEMLFDLLSSMELDEVQAALFEKRMIDFINKMFTIPHPTYNNFHNIKILAKVPIPEVCQSQLIEFLLNLLSDRRLRVVFNSDNIVTALRSMPLSREQMDLMNSYLVTPEREEIVRLPFPMFSLPPTLPEQKSKEEKIFKLVDRLLQGRSFFGLEDIFKIEIPSELILPVADKLLSHIEQYPVHNNKHATTDAVKLLSKLDLPNDNELTKRIISSYVPFFLKLTDSVDLFFLDDDRKLLFGQAKIDDDLVPFAIHELLKLIKHHPKGAVVRKAFQQLEHIVIPFNMIDKTIRISNDKSSNAPRAAGDLFKQILSKYELTENQEDSIFRFFFRQIKNNSTAFIADLKEMKIPTRWLTHFVDLLSAPPIWERSDYSLSKIMSMLDKLLPTVLEARLPLIIEVIAYYEQKSIFIFAAQEILKLTRSLAPLEQVRLAGILDELYGTKAILLTDCLLGRIKRDSIVKAMEQVLPAEMVKEVKSNFPSIHNPRKI